ncbi:MAG: UvrD-helicase domain-containing protein [Clostridia bacterium]|nr:UvrD-helicase domain-containing protein [Clostridia bacterium]
MKKFTDEQLNIINKQSGNIVVTASAGSGKTSVMTERYLRLVLDGKADADEILCVTFTRLAAEELRSRLNKSLRAAVSDADEAEAKRLKVQLEKLTQASICTIDSFCNTLVRKYFYVADVDPQFSIIDETVSASLKKAAVDELFEKLYDREDEALRSLLKTFISKRSDKKLKSVVLKASAFLSSETDGKLYMQKSLESYKEQGIKNVIYQLIGGLIENLTELIPPIDELISRCRELSVFKYEEFLLLIKNDIITLQKENCLSVATAFLATPRSKPRVITKNDEERKALSDAIDGIGSRIKSIKNEYYDILSDEHAVERAESAGRVLKALFEVVSAFDEEYSALKAEAGVLDYSDLEHYAYKILCSDEILAEIKKEYKYVFVDEYQDTNGIQEALFSRLENGDLFIVGDGKQSIYGFRGCDSSLFDDRIAAAKADELFYLNKNFRSTRAVVNAVNAVFSSVMTEKTAGVDYKSNLMQYGGLYGDTTGRAQIVSFSKPKKERAEIPEGVYSVVKHLGLLRVDRHGTEEAAVRRIIDKVYGEKYSFTAKDGTTVEKRIGYGDIAVLTRTSSGLSDRIVDELSDNGIPVVSESKRSIGEYPEISTLVSILETVYYAGREDYSLAAALKSPVGGLSDEELFLIRKTYGDQDMSFADAAAKYRSGVIDNVSVKLNEFFDYIDKYGVLSHYEDAASIIKRIIAEKRLDVFFMSSGHGKTRLDRVERFIAGCENGGKGYTLSEFVTNEQSILANMTVTLAGGENAVKVIDIHQSKGLEFPVVILCEMSRNFLEMGRRDEIVYSRKFGVGVNCYDADTKTVYPTVVKNYVSRKEEQYVRRDEMRLLYVGMTRAMYALYMVVGEELPNSRQDYEIASAKKFTDFLSSSVCEYVPDDESADSIRIKPEKRTVIFSDPVDERIENTVEKFLEYRYPYADDVELSVKRTVTDITRSAAEVETGENVAAPIFPSESESVTSGNAYHRFLQHCSLNKDLVKSDLDALIKKGVFLSEEPAALDVGKLENILSSPIFDEIRSGKIYREQPFICLVPASMAGERGDGEVLVQGVIDLLTVKGDKAMIVDYKYSSKPREKLLSTYRKQLELYAYAVKKVLKLNVEKAYVFNIKTLEATECDVGPAIT